MYTVLALIAANGDITPTGDDGNAFKESAHEANGDRARAGTRPVSEYGPGALRGQPGEVPDHITRGRLCTVATPMSWAAAA